MSKDEITYADMALLQQELWDIVSTRIGPEGDQQLLMVSGTLVATAIELYTIMLDDQEISKLLETVRATIPECREKMARKIGTLTLH